MDREIRKIKRSLQEKMSDLVYCGRCNELKLLFRFITFE